MSFLPYMEQDECSSQEILWLRHQRHQPTSRHHSLALVSLIPTITLSFLKKQKRLFWLRGSCALACV